MLINALWTWGGMFNILINHFTEFSSQPRPSFYHGVSHGFPFNLVKICKNILHISYLRIFPHYKIFREMVIIPFNLFHAKNIRTSYMTVTGRWLDVLPVFLRVGQVDVTHGDSNLDTSRGWSLSHPPLTLPRLSRHFWWTCRSRRLQTPKFCPSRRRMKPEDGAIC